MPLFPRIFTRFISFLCLYSNFIKTSKSLALLILSVFFLILHDFLLKPNIPKPNQNLISNFHPIYSKSSHLKSGCPFLNSHFPPKFKYSFIFQTANPVYNLFFLLLNHFLLQNFNPI